MAEHLIKQREQYRTSSCIRGGCGEARIFDAPLPSGAVPLSMASRIELQPGASIGVHSHDDDEEVYAVVSGSGVYISCGIEADARSGDIFVTKKGMTHGLRNDGSVPLVFFAVVAR